MLRTRKDIEAIFQHWKPEVKDRSVQSFGDVFAKEILMQRAFEDYNTRMRRLGRDPHIVPIFLKLFCQEQLTDFLTTYYPQKKKFLRFLSSRDWMVTFCVHKDVGWFRMYGCGKFNRGTLRIFQYEFFPSSFSEIRVPEAELAKRSILQGEYIRKVDKELFLIEWEKIKEIGEILTEGLPAQLWQGLIERETEVIWEKKIAKSEEYQQQEWVHDSFLLSKISDHTKYVETNQEWFKKMERKVDEYAAKAWEWLVMFFYFLLIIAYVVVYVYLLIAFKKFVYPRK